MTHSETIEALPPCIADGSKLLPEVLALLKEYPETPLTELIDIYVNEWADTRFEIVADQLESLAKEQGQEATSKTLPRLNVVQH